MSAGPSHSPSVIPQQWRQFTFFDVSQVTDQEDVTQPPKILQSLQPPIAITSTSPLSPLTPSIIISSGNSITILDRHFNLERSFIAWEGNGRAQSVLEAGGLLVAVGEEDGSRLPVLKIWDLTREEKKRVGGGPVLMRNVKIQNGQRSHPISSIALTSNLSHLAIGLGDGTVLLYRHLLQSLTTSPTSLTSLPKARVIHESPEPITGLGFREPSLSTNIIDNDKGSNLLSLFIVTVNRLLCAQVSGKGGEPRVLDDVGSGLGCAVMDQEKKKMVIASDEGIYLYDTEGKGASFAYEGPKSSVTILRHSLIITSPPIIPSANSNSATVRHHFAKTTANGDNAGSGDIAKITVFDLDNQLISYSGTFADGVRDVVCQWGQVYVFGNDGKLSKLEEQTTASKLETMYKRSLFPLALTLAKNEGITEAGIADVHRRYGDHLYTKGDFDGAMGQFVQTLGFLQPSYVIRKYLDAQRISNLTTYLQELHSRGLANPDHTTLLLNCYTKTSDRERLDAFIKTEARRSDGSETEQLPFDLDTAIRVCRQAGFYEHASYLASRYGRHEDFLRIQIEDAEEYKDALRYLRSLKPESCQENLVRYGQTLLQHEPESTTELLIELCSGTLGRVRSPDLNLSTNQDQPNTTGPAVLSYLGYNHVTNLFTNSISAVSPSPSPVPRPTTTGPSITTNKSTNGGERKSTLDSIPNPNPNANASTNANMNLSVKLEMEKKQSSQTYEIPSPRNFFSHFIDQPILFIKFLEAVAKARWSQSLDQPPDKNLISTKADTKSESKGSLEIGQVSVEEKEDQKAIWNTLLELYLSSLLSSDRSLAEKSRRKALELIKRTDLEYDPIHGLMLCSTVNFTDGLIFLWENMGMYEEILRYWISQPLPDSPIESNLTSTIPSDEVWKYLEKYGPTDKKLYQLVLRYFTSNTSIINRHQDKIKALLDVIDEEKIIPPLQIVRILSRNNVVSVGNVKNWLVDKVSEMRQEIDSDKHLVQSYRSETETKEKELIELVNPHIPQVSQVTRCSACGAQLDLPSVHFMCKHSYHQRCLSDSEPECILCARQHSIIREIRRNQTRLADRHDLFLSEVHEADDGFAVVAAAFGRGILQHAISDP
ncbi:vacuolar membrane protein [Tremella mesenterica]|uniref:E3 ubiquitin-protein ligase PEP5 n=1 Tax=Tremella mesenterica TaxID=5217 RepID=A0A4Q1BD76_TREME|nr:vacuolar membrane protein [Tremella mesenterica]